MPTTAPDVSEEPGAGGEPPLRRSLSLPLLVLYGLGTTVGAGIYALTGKIAGIAGSWAPAAFLLACVVAVFTALSFGELASRYPRSAGEAVYLRAGFGSPALARVGGLLVVFSGILSSATLAQAALGYAGGAWPFSPFAGLVLLITSITALAAWGIRESVFAAALLTLLEVAGIVLVSVTAAWFLAEGGGVATSPAIDAPIPVAGIFSGAVLGFYAFLGFEDMVNVAEEVRQPRRVLPLAIVLTLLITTVLYVLLATVAVMTVPPSELAESRAPLTLLYERAGGAAPMMISAIALAGMLNGILIQMIMASRVLYGLVAEGALPRWLGSVNARTRTPLRATCLAGCAVLVFAALLPLERLARATSWITLSLFVLIDWALFRIHRRSDLPESSFRLPRWVPACGAWLCAGMVALELLALVGIHL